MRAGSGDVACFFVAHRLAIDGSVGQGYGDRVKHGLEEADSGDDLSGGQALDEFVSFLLGLVAAVACRLQSIPPLATTSCPHSIQRFALTSYNVMPAPRTGSVYSISSAPKSPRTYRVGASSLEVFTMQ